jgi:hypothetical protein
MIFKKLKFGIYWDKNKEPYCPIHEKPLARRQVKIDEQLKTGLTCYACKHDYWIIQDHGTVIYLGEAKELI